MLPNLNYLPNERNFRSLNSINSTPEFQTLQYYIEITELFYDKIESDDFDSLYEKFKFFITNQDLKNEREIFLLRSFILNLLYHITFVRLKRRKIPVQLFYHLFKEKPELLNDFQQIIFCYTSFYESIETPFTSIFFSDLNDDFENDLNEKHFYSLYEEDCLKAFLKDDDVSKLQNYISKNSELPADYMCPLFHLDPINIEFSENMRVSINILDFCAFYGSSGCFKLLSINGNKFDEYTASLAVAGGNTEIINILVQNGIVFDSCFRTSIKYYRRSISEWLLSNYKCEFFDLPDCISFCDYRAFLFLLLNGEDPNKGLYNKNSQTFLSYIITRSPLNLELLKILIQRGLQINERCKTERVTSLYELCTLKYFDIEAIELLISAGANINAGSYTPLYALCNKEKTYINEIDFFLKKGANINAGDKTPLCALFSKHYVDYELVSYLFSKGADPNAGFETPLCVLFTQRDNYFNYEAITYLIHHGADINKEFYFKLRRYTPLNYFCSQSNVDISMLKFLIEMGADVNKTSTDSIGHEYTPLYALCSHYTPNVTAMKLLIENGADVNKGCKLPLYLLCSKQEINQEAIQLLVENGSKIDSKIQYTTYSRPQLKQLLNIK